MVLRLVEFFSWCDLFLCHLFDAPVSAAGWRRNLKANNHRALGWVFGWFGVIFCFGGEGGLAEGFPYFHAHQNEDTNQLMYVFWAATSAPSHYGKFGAGCWVCACNAKVQSPSVPLRKHSVCASGSPGTVSCWYNIDPFTCRLDSAGDRDLLIKQTLRLGSNWKCRVVRQAKGMLIENRFRL